MRSLAMVLAVWSGIVAMLFVRPPGNAFAWDSFGYHLYLPAFFVHHDTTLKDIQWVDEARKQHDASGTLYQITDLPGGRRVIRYPMGLALLWSPWYGIGHVIAGMTGAPTDGYSRPYQWCVVAGVMVYLLLGLLALRAVLLRRFSDGIAAAAILFVTVGTNYVDQATQGTTMPHATLFSLYAGILLFVVRWHERQSWKNTVILALLMGMATLCRPSEAVCVLLPVLWAPAPGAKAFLKSMWQHRKHWSLIALVMFLVGLPQFLYWKAAAGSFIINSYNNPGEGFDYLRPHVLEVLFSFRKGWFLYTPIMLVAVIGLAALRRSWPQAFKAVLAFFLVNLYVVSSWTCWWYADSFSSRALVGSYAVMALPLAALLDRATSWVRAARFAFIGLLGSLLLFNLFQQWQFAHGIIDMSRMTRAAYFAGFGRTQVPAGFEDLLRVKRSYSGNDVFTDGTRYRRILLPSSLTMSPPSDQDTIVRDPATGLEQRAVRLDEGHIYSPAVRIPYRRLTQRDHAWVECQWFVLPPVGVPAPKGSFVMTVEHGGNYGYRAFDIEHMGLRPGTWNEVRTQYLTPEIRDPEDPLTTYFWLRDTVPVLIVGPRIIVHEPLRDP